MERHECCSQKYHSLKVIAYIEIILGSFSCNTCGYKNTEATFGGQLADYGVKMTLKVIGQIHLHRFIIKSEYAKLIIPELDFEIPPQTQKGSMSTIEGIIRKSIEDLKEMQEERRKVNKDIAEKIDKVLSQLEDYAEGKVLPFTVVLYDPSGNSFIQNPYAPQQDPYLKAENFVRAKEQLVEMGYMAESDLTEEKKVMPAFKQVATTIGVKKTTASSTMAEQKDLLAQLKKYEVNITDEYVKDAANFSTFCYACTKPGEARSCTVNIPYFKELILMSFTCEFCGYRTVDINTGGGISEKGMRYKFDVKSSAELDREVFKSNSCNVMIPELDLDMRSGTLTSLYTTVEGLLVNIHEVIEKSFPFAKSDSSPEMTQNFISFSNKFKKMKSEGKFTLIMEDPLANSFIMNPNAPDEDPLLKKEEFDRTSEQNDELGITDMKV